MTTIALALEPTRRAVSIDTDDLRIERYLRSVYAPFVAADGAHPDADGAVLQTGCRPAHATFRGVPFPVPDPSDPACRWNSGSYVADQFVWQALARDDVWIPLHASALAIGGRGVLLAGPGGCGKTTLSLALGMDGAFLFGDEMALLHRRDRTVSALARMIGIRARSLDVLGDPELAAAVRLGDARVASTDAVHYVSAARLFSQPAFMAPRPLRAVFFIAEPAAVPALHAVARASAAMRIAPYVAGPRRGLAGVAGLTDLLGGASTFVLHPGEPAATARLVRETVTAC